MLDYTCRSTVVWRLTPFPIIIQLYLECQFYWLRKLEYPEKAIDLRQVTDKLYHIMLYRAHLAMNIIKIQDTVKPVKRV
jgi:hypothetical protein